MGTIQHHIAMATVMHDRDKAEAAFERVREFARSLSVESDL